MGVGIPFGTLLLALLSFIAFRLYKNSRSSPKILGQGEHAASTSVPENVEKINANTVEQQRYELRGKQDPKEMYTLHNTHEVEAEPGASELRNSGHDE